MTIELTFYTTEGCHLCDEANVLLQQVMEQAPEKYRVNVVDIVHKESLIQRYGTRIPVVQRGSLLSDLGWPFGYAELHAYIGACDE
jgi:thiol-disulfide isomerase/thioredoxin